MGQEAARVCFPSRSLVGKTTSFLPVAPFLGLMTLTFPLGVLGSCRPLPKWVASGEGRCRMRSP